MKHEPLIETIKLFEETSADSWRPWRSVIARLDGLEPEDPTLVERVTGRTDRTPIRELFAALGRSAGKTRAMSVIASALATRTYPHAIGERLYLGVFAPSVRQAQIDHGYIAGLLQSVPATAALISGEVTQTTIPLGDVIVECLPCNFKTLRSRSYLAVIVDEAAFLPTDESASPDTELLRAVRPGLARVPGSLLLVVSSPYARKGELYRAYEKHFAKAGSDTLFIKGSTLDFNPTFDTREIARAYEDDPISAASEYGGEFRSDIEGVFTIETLKAVTPSGVVELSPSTLGLNNIRAFVDPSGGSVDSFTLGIAATVKNVETLVAVREFKPPFSPEAVVADIATVLRTYRIRSVTGDTYSGEFVRELFRKAGIEYRPSPLNRSGIYLDGIALINSKRCALLDVPKLTVQLTTLERRTGRNSDVIDHPRGGHDDLANSAIGALVCGRAARTMWIGSPDGYQERLAARVDQEAIELRKKEANDQKVWNEIMAEFNRTPGA